MVSFATQFDSLGFIPGVVRGARSFAMSEAGELTGIYYPHVWVVGENVAECMAGNAKGQLASMYYLTSQHVRYVPPVMEPPEPHSMDGCRHGFYAFHEGSNDYHNHVSAPDGTVSGVIEGYGEVMLGTRGFRAMKARIVALSLTVVKTRSRDRVERMLDRYSQVPFFDTFERMVAEFPPDRGEQ